MGLRNECLFQQLLTQDHRKPLAKLMELAHTFEAVKQESLKCVDTNKSKTIVAASKAKFQGHLKASRLTRRHPGGDQQATPAAATENSHSLQCASCEGEHSRTFKLAMVKADPNTTTELQDCIIHFLARYRSTLHSVTNQSPSEMLNGRRIRTRLDLLHPCQPLLSKLVLRQKVYYDSHTKLKQFLVEESADQKL